MVLLVERLYMVMDVASGTFQLVPVVITPVPNARQALLNHHPFPGRSVHLKLFTLRAALFGDSLLHSETSSLRFSFGIDRV
jgi:hypothetical protein